MKIVGTGSALPAKIVNNDDLAQIMDTSDEWISSRTGIRARHLATTESTTGMSVEAAQKALDAAGIEAGELDLIIAATLSSDHIIPTLACEVQSALGAVNAVAFDIGAACSGFLFGLSTADAYFRTGRFHKALVIGAETLSKMMDWNDRGTCVLFGDGAGAVIVTDEGEDHLLSMVQGSDGAGGMALCCKNRPLDNPYAQNNGEAFKSNAQNAEENLKPGYVQMDGQAVYRFAVKTVPKAIHQALDEAGLTADDIDLFVLHQANLRIIESVAKRLKQPMEKFPTNLEDCGNISAASVPILLDKVVKDGMINAGDKIVLAGFGAGLTWGACVIRW